MITTRVAAALSLLLAVGAFALAVVAFTTTLRDDGHPPGRLVQTRINNTYTGAPVAFALDEFYLSVGSERTRALYVYPPGYYGHTRGCKVVWVDDEVVVTPSGMRGPGMFIDPCGGARFDRQGRLVAGPADRGLDTFTVSPAVDGYVVDTRTLYCGDAFAPDEPVAPPAPSIPAPGTPSASVAPATATPAASATPSPSPTPGREETCDRVLSSER